MTIKKICKSAHKFDANSSLKVAAILPTEPHRKKIETDNFISSGPDMAFDSRPIKTNTANAAAAPAKVTP